MALLRNRKLHTCLALLLLLALGTTASVLIHCNPVFRPAIARI